MYRYKSYPQDSTDTSYTPETSAHTPQLIHTVSDTADITTISQLMTRHFTSRYGTHHDTTRQGNVRHARGFTVGSQVGHRGVTGGFTGGSQGGHNGVTGGSQGRHRAVTGGSQGGHSGVTGGSQGGHMGVTGRSQGGHKGRALP